jgi:hypothetical protein
VEELREKGNLDLARQIERDHNMGPIGADGSMDLDAMQQQSARDLEELAHFAEAEANGGFRGAEEERSVLDVLTNNRPADDEPGPDEGRY